MTNDHARPALLETTDGTRFLAYPGQAGTVYLERIRPDGRRNASCIFQFEVTALLAALGITPLVPPADTPHSGGALLAIEEVIAA